ncbi:hypothetical protein L596_002460 [Steinernema carpocapsae]|uniref:Uncharacterized protein n=1 Tax=Steinernema carpocapsae TaxID=34508 RepID=A0A4U8UP89_STECR|nr:hypothetical protein L596_002460 [Steinernema carpocapsae]
MTSAATLLLSSVLAVLIAAGTNAQFFNREFFASVVDEPHYRQNTNNAYVSPEERLRELDEKLSTRITQQAALMRERIEQLEKQKHDSPSFTVLLLMLST